MRFSKTVVIIIMSVAALMGLAALNLRVFPHYWSTRTAERISWMETEHPAFPPKWLAPSTGPATIPQRTASKEIPPEAVTQGIGDVEAFSASLWEPFYYEFGVYEAAPEDIKRLARMAAYMNENDSDHLVITGYSTPAGKSRYNQFLAKQRARLLRDELVSLGVERRRIKIAGIVFAKREMYGQSPKEAHRAEFQLREQ